MIVVDDGDMVVFDWDDEFGFVWYGDVYDLFVFVGIGD